jgi:hypothetical protein
MTTLHCFIERIRVGGASLAFPTGRHLLLSRTIIS